MSGPLYDVWEIREGNSFTRTYAWTGADGLPVDLTGATANAMIRADIGQTNPDLALSAPDLGIQLFGLTGIFSVSVAPNQTSDLANLQRGSGGLQPRLEGVFSVKISLADGVTVKDAVFGVVVVERTPTRF